VDCEIIYAIYVLRFVVPVVFLYFECAGLIFLPELVSRVWVVRGHVEAWVCACPLSSPLPPSFAAIALRSGRKKREEEAGGRSGRKEREEGAGGRSRRKEPEEARLTATVAEVRGSREHGGDGVTQLLVLLLLLLPARTGTPRADVIYDYW
jgi:hypothetical protein